MVSINFSNSVTIGLLSATILAAFSEVVDSKGLQYRELAANTNEIRWYVMPGKKTVENQTNADFQYEYEVVHAAASTATANATDALRSYYQVYTYHDEALQQWDRSYAPYTAYTPLPSVYEPMALTRLVWSSYQALNESFDSAAYQNNTAPHVFSRVDQYGSALTPLARLTWDNATANFVDAQKKSDGAKFYVALISGDSSSGASHAEIYETLEMRRLYIENRLNSEPSRANGLYNFIQSGKSLMTGTTSGKPFMDYLHANSPFTLATFWKHVAIEEYWFQSAGAASNFFRGVPRLSDILWPGSDGSFTLAGEPGLVFDKDAGIL